MAKRKFNDYYVGYGFTYFREDEQDKPQCFLCGKILSNSSLKSAKLKKHFMCYHKDKLNKDIRFLMAMRDSFDAAQPVRNISKKYILEASCKASYHMTKEKKPRIITEKSIKPVELLFGEDQKNKNEEIPLSNNTFHSRSGDVCADLIEQVIRELKESPLTFSMQIDESTDVSQCCQLLVFVRYLHENAIKEEFLFCEQLTETTESHDVYKKIDTFFSEQNFDWKKKLGSICTDGARAMVGKDSDFTALVKKESPTVIITHCFLHRYALATRTLPKQLADILATSVQVVNFIRSRALNHCLFKVLCGEMGGAHEVLLYHTEVRWLSRGNVLLRLVELTDEVSMFLKEKYITLSKEFDDPLFQEGLSYLADIFNEMHRINLSMQGPNVILADANEIFKTLMSKIPLWRVRVEEKNYMNFPCLKKFISNDDKHKVSSIHESSIITHLQNLEHHLNDYFKINDQTIEPWVREPFLVPITFFLNTDICKDEMIELKNNEMMKFKFESMNLSEFWCSLTKTHPNLSERAISNLMPFFTTYLCESGFSTMLALKTKSRNRLHIQRDMRMALKKNSNSNLTGLCTFE